MDIQNMRQILAIREHGSFAKAARKLGMAQPSLSKAIARVEDRLGVKIFVRGATGAELTPTGELIAERAATVIAETQRLIRDAEMAAGGDAGVVRLGLGNTLRRRFLPGLVLRIAERHPKLHLHVEVLDRDTLLPRLQSRELDLIVCAIGQQFTDPGLVVTRLFGSGVAAVASPDHPLARQREVSLETFAKYGTASPSVASFTTSSKLGLEESSGFFSYTSNDYDALIPIVVAGKATLVAPHFVVRPHLEAGRLVRIDMPVPWRAEFGAVTTRTSYASPILKKVIDHARAVGAGLQAEGDAAG